MNKFFAALALSLFASTANAQAMDAAQMPCAAFVTLFQKPELLTPETIIALNGAVSALVAVGKGGEQAVAEKLFLACSEDSSKKFGEVIFNLYR